MARRKGLIARWAVCVRVSGGREVGFQACGTVSVVDQPDPAWSGGRLRMTPGIMTGRDSRVRRP